VTPRVQGAEEANSSLILPTQGQLGKALYNPTMEVSTISKQGEKLKSMAGTLSHHNLVSATKHELNPESEFNLLKGWTGITMPDVLKHIRQKREYSRKEHYVCYIWLPP